MDRHRVVVQHVFPGAGITTIMGAYFVIDKNSVTLSEGYSTHQRAWEGAFGRLARLDAAAWKLACRGYDFILQGPKYSIGMALEDFELVDVLDDHT
jgi:hypothetical protein